MDLKLRQWYGYERWACKCHSRGGGWSHKHDGIAQNIPEWEAREIGKKEEKWERGKEWEQKKKKERQTEWEYEKEVTEVNEKRYWKSSQHSQMLQRGKVKRQLKKCSLYLRTRQSFVPLTSSISVLSKARLKWSAEWMRDEELEIGI